jgi:hypothetical protein
MFHLCNSCGEMFEEFFDHYDDRLVICYICKNPICYECEDNRSFCTARSCTKCVSKSEDHEIGNNCYKGSCSCGEGWSVNCVPSLRKYHICENENS